MERVMLNGGRVAEAPRSLGEVKDLRIQRGVGQWRNCRVDDLNPQLDRFESAERAETGGAVHVKFDGNSRRVFLNHFNQTCAALRSQQPAGILQANVVGL